MNSDNSSAATPAVSNSAAPRSRVRRQVRLEGPSVALEAGRFAVRRDLAEIAVADRVFAQHYADALLFRVMTGATVRRRPDAAADARGTLAAGCVFHVFDIGRDWAWGRGADGPVGYVACHDLEAL